MSRVMSLTGGAEGNKTVIDITGFPSMKTLERDYFFAVLDSVSGSKVKAAKILGISVKSVYNKLEGYTKSSGSTEGGTVGGISGTGSTGSTGVHAS